jgi:hypothetical protein
MSFVEVEGYKTHAHLASGDDVFLMLSFADKWIDSVVSNPKSKITTNTVESWSEYFQQRNRWGKKVSHYKDKNILQTGLLFLLANLSMVVMLFSSFNSLYYLLLFLVAVLFRFSAEQSLLKRYHSYYNQNYKIRHVLILSILYPIVFLLTLVLGILTPGTWKGRKL